MSELDIAQIEADVNAVLEEIAELRLKFEQMSKDGVVISAHVEQVRLLRSEVSHTLERLHKMASVYYKLLDELRSK